MKAGLTGGAGFIGGWTAAELRRRGHEVLVFDTRGRGGGGEVMLGDIRDDVAVTEFAAHVDGIIHLASVLGTQETVANPRPAALTNITGALNVFEAAAQYRLPVVNICVGNHWMDNTYAIAKSCAERFGRMYAAERGVTVSQVRVVNAYGPRQVPAVPFGPAKVRKIIPAFTCRALAGRPVEVYGDGEQVSDMVHVADVAAVLVTALERAAAGCPVAMAEVGPAEHATVNEVAARVAASARALGHPRVPVTHLPMRPGEQPGARVTADVSTLAPLGIDPAAFIPLGEGIEETVGWYARHWLPGWREKATA